MKKILVVTHSNDLSGANKSLLSIIENLNKDFVFHVICNKKCGKLSDKLRKIENVKLFYTNYSWCFAQNRTNFFKASYRFLADAYSYYSKRKIDDGLINELVEEKYDFVYTNTSVVDFGYRISKVLNVPHIWHIREFGKEDFSFKRLYSGRRYNDMISQSDHIIFVSKALQKAYGEKYSINSSSVVYNGFEIGDLYYQTDRKEINFKDEINIAIIGQVSKGKGQDQAIKACEILIKHGYPIKLHILGQVDEDYLKKYVPAYKKYSWLKIYGQVNNVYEYRKKFDIELICSANEAFGRVCIEAMLHGNPVVGSYSGGTAELIYDKKNGLVYEPGNYVELAQKIKLLIDDPLLYKTIQKNAQEYAQNFTIGRTAENVKKIFDKFGRI